MSNNIRTICPELQIKARDEVNEVENRISEDIAKIREWIDKQPHLTARTNDQFLLAFLRGCKFSLEKTKSKIDHYYTIRSLSPEIFLKKQIDEKTMKLAKLGPYLPLRNPLRIDGPRIHMIRYGHIDFNEFSAEDIFKLQHRIQDIQFFEDDNICIAGVLNIVDMASVTLSQILKFDLVLIKKMGVFAEKALPFRIKGIHCINVPNEAYKILNIVRTILPTTIKERLVLHSSFESLYEHIPKNYLPEDYGGANGSFKNTIEHWENVLLRYKEFFEEDVRYGVNPKLRTGENISLESFFGLEGSFRQLEVD